MLNFSTGQDLKVLKLKYKALTMRSGTTLIKISCQVKKKVVKLETF